MNKNELIERTKAEEDPDKPIAAGDLVHLKSGGPTMTVRSIETDNVECEWFDKGALKTHKFKLHSVRRGPYSNRPIFSISIGADSDEKNDKPPWERGNESAPKDE
jgi:uncharacterized protein YodC (DUF2158 family)